MFYKLKQICLVVYADDITSNICGESNTLAVNKIHIIAKRYFKRY